VPTRRRGEQVRSRVRAACQMWDKRFNEKPLKDETSRLLKQAARSTTRAIYESSTGVGRD